MSSTSSSSPPPVRDIVVRLRDNAIVASSCGAFLGACMATRQHASAFSGMMYGGAAGAALATSFIGLRHGLIQGRWEEDREVVSGLSAATIGAVATALRPNSSPPAIARSGLNWFLGGCALHYAHRWWLYYRLLRSDHEKNRAA